MWDDAATSDGALDKGVEFHVLVYGELQVAGSHVPLLCLFRTNKLCWPMATIRICSLPIDICHDEVR